MADGNKPEVTNEAVDYIFIATVCTSILSLAANVSIIIYICCRKRGHTALNIAMSSMAVADILTCTIVAPSSLVITSQRNPNVADGTTAVLCKLNKYIFYWCKSVKIYSILAMVWDRYQDTIYPNRTINSAGRCIFFLSIVWFFGAAFNIWEVVLSTSALINLEDDSASRDVSNITLKMCIASNHFRILHSVFKILGFIIIYGLPFLLLLYALLRVTCELADLDKRQLYNLTLAVTCSVLFYACHLPADVVNYMIYYTMAEINIHSIMLSKYLDCLSYSHSFLNACAFVVLSPDIHESFRKCFRVKRQQASVQTTSNSDHDSHILQMPLDEV